ncbi:NUDIX hydrolase [Paenochrobactrum pullorum]|uniref:NUDIX hydrolase n=1 Tax=Paenochrobactrum pullorum TaxID=1324351 RepID=UPI0035BC22CB
MDQCRENTVYKATQIDVRIVDGPLDYAVQHSEAIAENWQQEVKRQSALFNGELYLAPEARFENGVFEAGFIRDFYATLMYWRKDQEPVRPWHIFGIGVIVSSDNVLIAARMGGSTAAASRIYFPAGSIDDHDVKNGFVDYDFNMHREVKEETGLDLRDAQAEEGYILVTGNRSVALFKRHYFDKTAAELTAQIRETLAAQVEPELDDVIAVSAAGMMGEDTPTYVRAFADWHFSDK